MPNNPDFSRFADEVVIPENVQYGWAPDTDEKTAVYREREGLDRLANDMPVAFSTKDDIAPDPEIITKFNQFQKDRGRFPGSCDWSLMDEFIWGRKLLWLPQIIGSCVVSNTFRGVVIRHQYQVVFQGQAQEYYGVNEFSSKNFAFYCPYTYGCARKRGNLRGGDGLFGDVMAESMLKDGFLLCSTPELVSHLNTNNPKDYPEPQNPAIYRDWGNWNHIERFKQYADFGLDYCPPITNVDDLVKSLKTCNPVYCCSMLAIKKKGNHPDGFAIHTRNTGDQWAHNMCFHGFFYASDGEMYIVFSNESWGEQHIYAVHYNEVKNWFQTQNLTCYQIGNVKAPTSMQLIAA